MKRIISIKSLCSAVILILASFSVNSQTIHNNEISIDSINMIREGNNLRVFLNMNISQLNLSGNKSIILVPFMQTDIDELQLPAIEIMGHKQYLFFERNMDNRNYANKQIVKRNNGTQQSIVYYTDIEYQDWMNGANLYIGEDICGCCNKVLSSSDVFLCKINLMPVDYEIAFITPEVESIKERNVKGSAYVDFPINVSEILQNYSNNAHELAKINATIDTIKNDNDITIKSIFIKGFASPSGPYLNNVRLAKERSIAVENYVKEKYNFNKIPFTVESEPEDWKGVAAYLDSTNLKDKELLLKIATGDLEPDAREWKIKTQFPHEYKILFERCYPTLRHTEYVITYTVRGFDVAEAIGIISQSPQKLSLQEMYLVAQSYREGSDEYNNVFEIAVKMFPNDETANLNAANIALKNNNLKYAAKYLNKAGNSPQAINARGILAAKNKDRAAAKRLFMQAKKEGLNEASINITKI